MDNLNFMTIKAKCPSCGHLLNDRSHKVDTEPGIHLLIRSESGKGDIWLSSIYGSYNSDCNINVKDGESPSFSCPFCKEELTAHDTCSDCNSALASLTVEITGTINICTKKGCTTHHAEFVTISDALTRLYNEMNADNGEGKK